MMKKKILIFGVSKDTLSGGQVMMLNLIKRLDKKKFDVHVRLQYSCPLSDELDKEDVQISFREFPKIFSSLSKFKLSFFLFPILRMLYSWTYFNDIKNEHFDYIWCENLTVLLFSAKYKFTKTKVIANMWSNVNSSIGLKLINFLSDHIILEAKFQKKRFNGICKSDKISIINTQISPDVFFSEVDHDTHPKLNEKSYTNKKIGFLGGCRYAKGFDMLVDISHKLIVDQANSNYEVICCGSSVDDDLYNDIEINRKIKEMGSNFIIQPWITNRKYFYNNIDIFLSLSRSEGLPGTVREAMGFGKPVIGSDVGGTSEVIDNEELVIDIANYNETIDHFAHVINKVLNDELYYSILSKKLSERANSLYIGYEWVSKVQDILLNLT